VTAALLALLLVGAPPGAAAKEAPPLEVLQAEQVEYDVANERGVATGGVVLRRGVVVVRAERASYDLRTGEIDASGSVLLTEPGRVLSASAMHLVLDGPFHAREVVAFLKDAPLDLSSCRTLEEGRRIGRNRLTLRGTELEREPPPAGEPDRYDIERARVTMCDCGGGSPSWEIRSSSADVVPGKRAILTWPVFYVTPLHLETQVPVFVFPVMYLPLGDRQSGLLPPDFKFGGVNGLSLPLFLTLGRSWDATITADYNWGPTDKAVKGPGTSLELRWAPVEGMYGMIRGSLLHSQVETWSAGAALPPGWNRIALSAVQDHRISDRTRYRLELALVDDPLYLQHFTGDALLRATEYSRSAFAFTHRTDDLVLAFEAAYHLPLSYLDSLGASPRAPFGTFGADLSAFHRLPSASVSLLPQMLVGPVHVSGMAEVARFAPLRGATGDEGRDGVGPGQRTWAIAPFLPYDAGERNGVWDGPAPGFLGERLAATRALMRAEIRAPMSYRSILDVEPWIGATASAYAFQESLSPQADARAVGGIALSTRIGRTFGTGPGRLRHEIEPRVEWRGGTAQAGPGLPNYAYDEFDVALPPRIVDPATGAVLSQRTLSAIPGAFSQVQLSVRNRLIAPAGPLSNAVLDLILGQDLDLSSGLPSETWARAILSLRYLRFDGLARFRAFGAKTPAGTPAPPDSSFFDAFTELSGNIALFDARGDNVHAGLFALGAGASPRLLAGLEPLFDLRPTAAAAIAQGSVGFSGRWSGATLNYDALFYARQPASLVCGNKTISSSPHVFQHQATVTWDSPCRCWKAGVAAVLNECDELRFKFIIDLSSIGGRAVGFGG
jgi:LPS-assembly protein